MLILAVSGLPVVVACKEIVGIKDVERFSTGGGGNTATETSGGGSGGTGQTCPAVNGCMLETSESTFCDAGAIQVHPGNPLDNRCRVVVPGQVVRFFRMDGEPCVLHGGEVDADADAPDPENPLQQAIQLETGGADGLDLDLPQYSAGFEFQPDGSPCHVPFFCNDGAPAGAIYVVSPCPP